MPEPDRNQPLDAPARHRNVAIVVGIICVLGALVAFAVYRGY